ncbi:MAG: hypothetical protein WC907_07590 [Acholeplasmataceae bacterium]
MDLDKIYTYHAPKEGQAIAYGLIRDTAKELAKMIEAVCPDSREKNIAFMHIEDAVMWANASIARS